MSNDFSSLSAESDLSSLAQVACNEGEAPQAFRENFSPEVAAYLAASKPAPRARTPRPLNLAALCLHNLTAPYARRVHAADLCAKVSRASRRGELAALAATIRGEVHAERAIRATTREALFITQPNVDDMTPAWEGGPPKA